MIALATVAAVAVIGATTWAVYPRSTPALVKASVSAPPTASAAPAQPAAKSLDTDRTLAEARRRALKWSPEALLVKIEAGPVRAGLVDASAGGNVSIHFGKPGGKVGPGAKVGLERLVVSESASGLKDAEEKGTEEVRAVADPECGLHQAWRKAVAAGLPSSADPTFSYAFNAKHDRAVWHAEVSGDPKLSRTLDGRNCNILTR